MRLNRRAWLSSLFFAPPGGTSKRVLVSIFLRGGADGLSLVVPHFEDRYYRLRPTLGIPRPDSRASDRSIDLDGRFSFHPSFEPLTKYFREERLSIVHAVGSGDETRSHFEAQDRMERGGPDASGGWIARHLRSRGGGPASALSAVAISTQSPESLRGAQAAIVRSLEELELQVSDGRRAEVTAALRALYGGGGDAVRAAGRDALDVMQRLKGIEAKRGGYPGGAFSGALSQVAALIRTEVGMEAATVDLGGWDTHYVQGGTSGLLAGRIAELATGLDAFCRDLGPKLDDVVITVQTEFGRRTYENGSFGTDHGRASVMMILGGGVTGGRVITDWPGLDDDSVEGPGDLRVTTDYRTVLAEVIQRGLGNPAIRRIFPGLKARPLGLFG